MSVEVVEEKMESLRRCLRRIESRVPSTPEELKSDLDLQDILTLNLERAVQQVVDITLQILSEGEAPLPNTMADCVRALVPMRVLTPVTAERMVKAIGFRNLAVHAYQDIDWDIVHAIATRHIEDFRQFMREVSAQLLDTR